MKKIDDACFTFGTWISLFMLSFVMLACLLFFPFSFPFLSLSWSLLYRIHTRGVAWLGK